MPVRSVLERRPRIESVHRVDDSPTNLPESWSRSHPAVGLHRPNGEAETRRRRPSVQPLRPDDRAKNRIALREVGFLLGSSKRLERINLGSLGCFNRRAIIKMLHDFIRNPLRRRL